MLFYIKSSSKKSYIFDAVDNVGYVLKGKDMNDRYLENYSSGDVVPDVITDQLFKDSSTHITSCIVEFESGRSEVEVYKTVDSYQVVTDGVIRHENADADAVIRVITHYTS